MEYNNAFKNAIFKIENDGYLDTTNANSLERFKHNIKILIEKAKKDKKIDKFMIIRTDNFFPVDWEWTVASRNTNIEKVVFALSNELRVKLALDKSKIKSQFNGINIPIANDKLNNLMSDIDKDIGAVYLPVKYRSTKHFTINTPLDVTGDYNLVSNDRDFTIIDEIDNFLNSGYAYSVAYHDAYLDVSHENLAISKNAIILINESKYQKLMHDPVLREQLSKRKIIIYKGEEYLAINMILSQIGVLPSKIGNKYAFYDNEINEILENSIKNLALSNGLLYNKSHGGKLSASGGHFSSYFDDQNNEFNQSINEFLVFLKNKFSSNTELINMRAIEDSSTSNKLIESIGANNLLDAINEFNILSNKSFKVRSEKFREDRKKLTPEISILFKRIVKFIDNFYNNEEYNNYEFNDIKSLEEDIKLFYQADTVTEQLYALNRLLKFFNMCKIDQVFENDNYSKK